MIARRELPHPGAQLTFTDIDGHRYQVFVTDLADTDIAYLEALYRGRGRAERQICDTKATGLTNLPSHSFAINTAWLQLVLSAHDLLAWTRAPRPRRHDLATRRTQTTPLLPVPHRRPSHHHRPTNASAASRTLALDPRARHRVRPRPLPAATDLTGAARAHSHPQTTRQAGPRHRSHHETATSRAPTYHRSRQTPPPARPTPRATTPVDYRTAWVNGARTVRRPAPANHR